MDRLAHAVSTALLFGAFCCVKMRIAIDDFDDTHSIRALFSSTFVCLIYSDFYVFRIAG
jgi:hypothetical protein